MIAATHEPWSRRWRVGAVLLAVFAIPVGLFLFLSNSDDSENTSQSQVEDPTASTTTTAPVPQGAQDEAQTEPERFVPNIGYGPAGEIAAADAFVRSPFGIAYPRWAAELLTNDAPLAAPAGHYERLTFGSDIQTGKVEIAVRPRWDIDIVTGSLIADFDLTFAGIGLVDGPNRPLFVEDLDIRMAEQQANNILVTDETRLSKYVLAAEGPAGRVNFWIVPADELSIIVMFFEPPAPADGQRVDSELLRLLDELLFFDTPTAEPSFVDAEVAVDWWQYPLGAKFPADGYVDGDYGYVYQAPGDGLITEEEQWRANAQVAGTIRRFSSEEHQASATVYSWFPGDLNIAQQNLMIALGVEFEGDLPTIERSPFAVSLVLSDLDGRGFEVDLEDGSPIFSGRRLSLPDGTGGQITYYMIKTDSHTKVIEVREPAGIIGQGLLDGLISSIVFHQGPG